MTTEFELTQPPTDGITNLCFAKRSDTLLVSSWDSTVRLYDVKENRLCYKYDHEAPVLDCCFGGDNASSAYSAGVDQSVKMVNLETGVQRTLGGHNKAIKCVEYSNTSQLCVTGSWDCAVKLWDHRAANALIGQVYQQGKKVYTMALTSTRVVVGTSDRQVFIYDIRKIAQPEQVRESSLVNQTRCIRTFPDENGYALSSIEGRVAIEYFDVSPEAQRLKYAFKCHRSTVGNKTTLYPVNSIAFHPIYGTFATGGCDGQVNVWDYRNKKRTCQYKKRYPTSIASLAFSPSGDFLAIAASYTFEQGEKETPADSIHIRTVKPNEVMPKKRKSAK